MLIILPWSFRVPVVRVAVQPLVEPVTLAEAKKQCRADDEDTHDDDYIMGLIAAARMYCESRKGYAFVEQTLIYSLPCFFSGMAIELPRATPLRSIESVTYKDSDNIQATWSAANYEADTDAVPGLLVPIEDADYPSATLWPVNPVKIRYVAGSPIGSPAEPLSPAIQQAIKLLVGHWYQNREPVSIGFETPQNVPYMVDSLLGVDQRVF